MKHIITGVLLIGALLFASCQSSGEKMTKNKDIAVKKALTVYEQDLYPEGIAYSAKLDKIFVSSMKYGKVGTVSPTGQYADFISDDETFVSISGLYVDDMHNRLIISNVDPGAGVRTSKETQGVLAGIGIYDINTKERLAYHTLQDLYEGGHFSNEITVAKDGTMFITDSFSPVIYRISSDLSTAEVFVEDARFVSEKGFNLNGIHIVKDMYLVVAKSNSGELFRIDIKTKEVSPIMLSDGLDLTGADGLVITGTRGVIVSNAQNALFIVEFDNTYENIVSSTKIDNNRSAGAMYEIADSTFLFDLDNDFNFPTTLVEVNENMYYILNPTLGALFQGQSQESFDIGILYTK